MELNKENLSSIKKILEWAISSSPYAKIDEAICFVNQPESKRSRKYPDWVSVALEVKIIGDVLAEEDLLAQQEKIIQLWSDISGVMHISKN